MSAPAASGPAAGAVPPALEPLRKRLAGKDPPRVVAAIGADAYLREAVLKLVAEIVLGAADSPDLVTVRADDPAGSGPDEAVARFFDETRTGNLFGGAKVVALRGANLAAAVDKKAFAGWAADPPSAAVSVLIADDLPKEVLEALGAKSVRVDCGAGRNAQRPEDFAVARAAARGKRLGRAEADLLVSCVGDDSSALDNAVEVLSLYLGDEPAITAASIKGLFDVGGEGNQWAFGDRLAEGAAAEALTIAQHCFEEGLPDGKRVVRDEKSVAIKLLNAATMSVSRARAFRVQMDAGVPRQNLAVDGLPPFLRDGVMRLAQSRRREAWDAMLLAVEDADRGMKSGGAQGRVAIARLAIRAGLTK